MVRGKFNTAVELPVTGNSVGDAYFVGEDLFGWDGSGWVYFGPMGGPKGVSGPSGASGMPGNYAKRLKEVDLTYRGVKVTISSYDDIGDLFLDPDDLQKDDLAIFETTYPEEYKDFRDKWTRERAIQIATDEVEEWRKDYEKNQ